MSIDRRAVVDRHRIRLTAPDPVNAISVGNGDFAYTADLTGMQTFVGYHDPVAAMRQGGAALNTATMASWGWHEMPNPENYVLDDAMTEYETPRGPVSYPDRYDMTAAMQGRVADEHRAGAWLHVNPQRIDLGRIGLVLRDAVDGAPLDSPETLEHPVQELDLWSGLLRSTFAVAGVPVTVETAAAGSRATVAFRIVSPLLADGRARVALRFPYAHDGFMQTDDWASPDRHTSTLEPGADGAARIRRRLDDTAYTVDVAPTGGRVVATADPHVVEVVAHGTSLELVVAFDRADAGAVAGFDRVAEDSARTWEAFWRSGAALDLSGGSDPRAAELERRVVLSQYLTAVHSAGALPPAETGLLTNSWQGKFHLEMHFWHAAHFAAWGRPALLQRSLGWYRDVLPVARATAARQGYPGARWPKHVGPDGRESPSPIGALLIWQQPHILYLLELVWNVSHAAAREALLADFGEVVAETATFMAAFPEEIDGIRHLGPPVMPAQEFYDARTTTDPTFELAYWWWGLEIAQRWRERAGRGRSDDWDLVQTTLARPRVVDGLYRAVASDAPMRLDDHPSLIAALGMVPATPLIDPETMEATLRDVLERWEWPSAWGWDFPVLAMSATRLGRPELAVDALLRDEVKNRHTTVGHNPQMGGILPLYLPGNGALLAAVSLMAAGGADGTRSGFPADWSVRAEGFTPWP
jgi:hypothetical protein